MKIPDKYRLLLWNTGLMFLGTFGSKLISFVMLPFYTLWLSVEDYGTTDIINVYSTIIVTVVSLCIAEAIFVIPSRKSKDDQISYFTTSQIFALVCACCLGLFYALIRFMHLDFLGSLFDNIGYVIILSICILLFQVAQQFCKCIDRVKSYAFAGIVNMLLTVSLGVILIPKYGVKGYVWGIIISNYLSLIYVYFDAKLFKFFKIETFSEDRLRELLKYSIPLIPNSIIWLLVSYINRPLMETYLGMYAIGIYALANKFPTFIATVYNNFSNSWQISVLEEFGKDGYNRYYNKVTLFVFAGLSFLVSIFSLIVGPLISFFLSVDYLDSIPYVPILCLSVPFVALASMVGANFSAIRKSKYFFYSSIWSAGSAILFNALLIPTMDIYGACWACVISYVTGALTRCYYARKIVKLENIWLYIIICLASLIQIILISYYESYMISVSILLLQILYFISYYFKIKTVFKIK